MLTNSTLRNLGDFQYVAKWTTLKCMELTYVLFCYLVGRIHLLNTEAPSTMITNMVITCLLNKKIFTALIDCGSIVDGELKSPGYPNNYPNNMDCYYNVSIPNGSLLAVYFFDFYLDGDFSCT